MKAQTPEEAAKASPYAAQESRILRDRHGDPLLEATFGQLPAEDQQRSAEHTDELEVQFDQGVIRRAEEALDRALAGHESGVRG